jgi:hypothetical protein
VREAGPPNNTTTVAAIPTRADHGNSEDGVLGMSLQPGFDLENPNKRHIYVYYSGPVAFDNAGKYTVEYRATDRDRAGRCRRREWPVGRRDRRR